MCKSVFLFYKGVKNSFIGCREVEGTVVEIKLSWMFLLWRILFFIQFKEKRYRFSNIPEINIGPFSVWNDKIYPFDFFYLFILPSGICPSDYVFFRLEFVRRTIELGRFCRDRKASIFFMEHMIERNFTFLDKKDIGIRDVT